MMMAWTTGARTTGARTTGVRGQALAAGLAVLAVVLFWLCGVAPALSWFDRTQMRLGQQQALLLHMRAVAATLPRLREAATSRPKGQRPEATAVLPGATDALAAAALQERVQRMAASVGASLAAVETMPAVKAGAWRKVSLRISFNAPWPVLVDLLGSIQTSLLCVDDLDLHSAGGAGPSAALPIQASMVLYGLTSAQAGPVR